MKLNEIPKNRCEIGEGYSIRQLQFVAYIQSLNIKHSIQYIAKVCLFYYWIEKLINTSIQWLHIALGPVCSSVIKSLVWLFNP